MRKLNRRDFLKTTAGAVGAYACCAAGLGPNENQMAWAANPGGRDAMLVLLNQGGGCDHLDSFAIPFNEVALWDRRPTIMEDPATVLRLNGSTGLNWRFPNLKRMYDNGDVAIVQGCGVPTGTRSHENASKIVARGSTHSVPTSWIGRLCSEYFQDIEYNTLALSGSAGGTTATRNRPIKMGSLGTYDVKTISSHVEPSGDKDYRVEIAKTLLNKRTRTAREKAVQGALESMYGSLEQIAAAAATPLTGTYGGYTSNYFTDVARVAKYGLGTKLTIGGAGGWDCHPRQRDLYNNKYVGIDNSLRGLETDLKAIGKWESTTVIIYTEFGRTINENSGRGTDHGNAMAMVLVGGSVRGGVYGPEPTSSVLRNATYVGTDIDTRNVFAEAISWLGYDPGAVFTQNYTKTNLNLFA